jgi:hypothetical protein
MSLFVGNISNRTTRETLESLFGRVGKCTIDLRVK